ncbi:zinc ribbon domain-containing protein [Mariniblastus sp.]|nr:zinc ribbon domain-containing protein [Mariniblastus sp.]
MPLYEFVCSNCRTQHELLVSHDAKPPCPDCDQPKLERQLSIISSPSKGGTSAAPAVESCGTPRCCGGG